MLSLQLILDQPAKVKKAIKEKNLAEKINPETVNQIINFNDRRLELIQQTEILRQQRNQLNSQIKNKPSEAQLKQANKIKKQLQDLEPELNKVQQNLHELILRLPNIPAPEVPVGEDEKSNQVVRTGGTKPKFDFPIKDHIELGLQNDLLDLERGAKVAGFRGYYLKNQALILHLALMQYALQKLQTRGFIPIQPPAICDQRAFVNSGHFPWGVNEAYRLAGSNQYLAGTAEIGLVSYHQDEILQEKNLPKKYAGFSSCYRREVGSYGKDTRGIYRIHEFLKIEQVIFDIASQEKADQWLEELIAISEEILNDLNLHYRVMLMCTGDMGEPQYKKYDIETWMPGRGEFGETHSASNMLDFQARRANTRYKDKSGQTKFVYTLNNTMIASPRILIALWETHQQPDGSIKIPDVLHSFCNFSTIKN
jgi:seryl-tRNA synthetase